jgi:hypothetical protein
MCPPHAFLPLHTLPFTTLDAHGVARATRSPGCNLECGPSRDPRPWRILPPRTAIHKWTFAYRVSITYGLSGENCDLFDLALLDVLSQLPTLT